MKGDWSDLLPTVGLQVLDVLYLFKILKSPRELAEVLVVVVVGVVVVVAVVVVLVVVVMVVVV